MFWKRASRVKLPGVETKSFLKNETNAGIRLGGEKHVNFNNQDLQGGGANKILKPGFSGRIMHQNQTIWSSSPIFWRNMPRLRFPGKKRYLRFQTIKRSTEKNIFSKVKEFGFQSRLPGKYGHFKTRGSGKICLVCPTIRSSS